MTPAERAAVEYVVARGRVGDPPAAPGVVQASRDALVAEACSVGAGLSVEKIRAIAYAVLQVRHSMRQGLSKSEVLPVALALHGADAYRIDVQAMLRQ